MIFDEFEKFSSQNIWINQTNFLSTINATLHIGGANLKINTEYLNNYNNFYNAQVRKSSDGSTFLATSIGNIDGDSYGVAVMQIHDDGGITDIYVVNELYSGNQTLLDFEVVGDFIWVLYYTADGVRYAKYDFELNKLEDAIAVDDSVVTRGISEFLFTGSNQFIISTIRPDDAFSSTRISVTKFDQSANSTTTVSMDSIYASELKVETLNSDTAIAVYMRQIDGWDLFLAKVDLNSGELLSESRANFVAFGNQIQPELTKLSDGQFLLSWCLSDSPTELYGRIIDRDGNFTTLDLNLDLEGYQHTISPSDDGGFIVVTRDGDTIKASSFNSKIELVDTTSTIIKSPFSSLESPISNGVEGNYNVLSFSDSYVAYLSEIVTNNPPTGYVELFGKFEQGANISVANFISDLDGYNPNSVNYSWLINETVVQSSADASLLLDQSHVGQTLSLRIDFIDSNGTDETVKFVFTDKVQNVNDAPVGFNVQVNGNATEETTLTAIASVSSDDDGLPNPLVFTYQWQSSADGVEWVDIVGATSAQFTPEDAEVGLQLRSIASYEDLYGTVETVSSDATAAIQAVNDAAEGMVSLTSSSERLFDEFQVNTYTVDSQDLPSVASLNDGGFIVTWTSLGQDGSGWGIYGQRYDVNGLPAGDEFQVNTYTEESQYWPSVTSLSNGGFVVIWSSNYNYGDPNGIYGQRYDANGTREGDEFQVNTFTNSSQLYSSVTSLNDGGFVVTWESMILSGGIYSGREVYGQRYDATGTREGDEFQVNTYTSNVQEKPSVTSLTDGGFVITWASSYQDGSFGGIYGQRYDANGTREGDEFQVNTYTDGWQYFPSVTPLTDGGFVVTWMSDGQDGSGNGIFGQRYDATGTREGDEFQVNTYTVSAQETPSVTSLTDGGFVVTWMSDGQDGSGWGIFGQRYDANGTREGDEFQVNTYTSYNQWWPSVTSLNDGGFVVTWTSFGYNIDGQRFLATGEKQGFIFDPNAVYVEGVAVKADTSFVSDPDGLGTFTYQWQRTEDAGQTWFDIAEAVNDQYLLTNDDALNQVRLEISYVDGQGFENVVYSDASPTVQNVNEVPVGLEVAVTGDATENAMLAAEATVVSDGDGLPDPLEFAFQWQSSSDNGVSWADIEGATASTLTLDDAQVDQQVRLVASYTDSKGTVESVASAATAAVENVNDAPTGTVTVSGTAQEDQTLYAISTLADEDGLGELSYQWLADGEAIDGETSNSLTLGQTEVGKAIHVTVSYTDDQGTNESVTSNATSFVQNVNDAPTGTVTVSGTAQEDQTLYAVSTLADEDGLGTLSYQWLADGEAIDGATSNSLTLGQSEVGKAIRVTVSYTDDQGTNESVTSNATSLVQNVNDAPTGSVTVSGTAQEDQTLYAVSTLADEDGLGTLSYQWLADGEAIDGATSNSLTLGQTEVGKAIHVSVSYTDGYGTVETVTSAQTDPVKNSLISVTSSVVSRFGSPLEADDIIAYETASGEQFYVRQINGTDDTSVFQIIAAPTTSVASIDLTLTANSGVTNFTLSDEMSAWTSQTNTNIADTVVFSAFGAFDGSLDLPAGQEMVIATFTSGTAPDLLIDGIALNDAVQSDVSVKEVTASSQDGGITTFEFNAGSNIMITADHVIDDLSQDAIGAFDALQALRLAVGLTKSDGTAEWHDYIAADINKDGRVGADDALNILKYAVGLTDGPSIDWVFVDSNADWSSIDRGNTSYDEGISLGDIVTDTGLSMTAILVGDVSGSY